MQQITPFPDKKFKKNLARGHSPDPTPNEEGTPLSTLFGVTLRLLVINTSSSVSREQQTTPLNDTNDECHQLATVRSSCVTVYNTWRSDR